MFCKFCGREIENDSQFCRYCGQSMNGRNFVEFNNSIRVRIERIEPNFYINREENTHLCYIVISKDQQSISIIEDDVNRIDFYDCYAIIAVLRYDCRNGFGYHYNRFEKLGFYNAELEPLSKLKIGRYFVEEVSAVNNTPAWGYIRSKDIYDNRAYFNIFKNDPKIIKWDDNIWSMQY